MVFGRIYDLEPQPTFFNVRQFKDEGYSRYKKAKRSTRRGVVLFVDPPEIKYKEVRRRPFSGSKGFNSQVRANPQMANFYQLNKIALSQMNKKVIERVEANADPLKMAELALLAKINENLEKKETVTSIAQTEPDESQPEMIDQIIQAQTDLGNIEEENKVLQEQLKQTRQQLNTLTKEKKAVQEDEERDKKILEQVDADMLEQRRKMVIEETQRNRELVQERMKPFEPEKKSVAEKIEIFGGGGLPQKEKLVEEGEVVLTEAQERAFMEKFGKEKDKGKKQKLLTEYEQAKRVLSGKQRALTRFKNDLPFYVGKLRSSDTTIEELEGKKFSNITPESLKKIKQKLQIKRNASVRTEKQKLTIKINKLDRYFTDLKEYNTQKNKVEEAKKEFDKANNVLDDLLGKD